MVIPFIGKVRPPSIVYLHPSPGRSERGQNPPTFLIGRFGRPNLPAQEILVLEPKRVREDRLVSSFQRPTQDLSGSAATRSKRGNEHVGVDHDYGHHDSIYAIMVAFNG